MRMVRYGLQQSRACFALSANRLSSIPRPWLVHLVASSVGTDIDLFSFQESLRSAFLARVHDSSVAVLNALYSEPSSLLPVLLSDPPEFIKAVSGAVTAKPSHTSRAILRAHISFLALHFLPVVPQDLVEDAFSRAIFPFLLFSKPKFRTAQAIWEIVEAAQKNAPESGLARCESFEGCVEIIREEERRFLGEAKARKDKSVPSAFENVDVMRRINLTVASRMGGEFSFDFEGEIVY